MKPLLSLDIDGTLTREHHKVPDEVLQKLSELAKKGWEILFITGRSFIRSAKLFDTLTFPYHLAVLNGAEIFSMPSATCIYSQLLPSEWLPSIERICRAFETGAVVYISSAEQDVCYFRQADFSPEMQGYLLKRRTLFDEVWEELEDRALPCNAFAAIKCFGERPLLEKMKERFKEEGVPIDFCLLNDRYKLSSSVGLGTRHDVTKGSALEHFMGRLGGASFVAAAGDDLNDVSMFKVADFKITLEGAPEELVQMADLKVPSAENKGILEALKFLEEMPWQTSL